MKVTPGSTDVTTYVSLVLSADGSDATGLTVTDFDLQYVRSGATPAAKVDASALGAANAAHADNSAIEIDATDQPGLYRVDWPDAAFSAGVREVVLTVKHASCRAAHTRVELETIQTGDSYARLGAPAGASVSADIAAIKAVVDAILTDTGTTLDAKIDALGTLAVAIDAKTANLPAAPAAVGDIPTANQVRDAVFAQAIEGAITFLQSQRLQNSAAGGKSSGLETNNAKFRDLADTKDRIDATVDADGNRSAITLDLT